MADPRHPEPPPLAELRVIFEASNRDAMGFSRSHRGFYNNPPISRDWKWFQLGAQAYRTPLSDVEQRRIENLEAAKLQSFLIDNHMGFRPNYPSGLFAWALAVLQMHKEHADDHRFDHF